MLILFDIDATLITTSRTGIAAMQDAGRGLYGPGFTAEGTDFAGRLDPLIIADLLRNNGLEPTPRALADLREGYRASLGRRLAVPGIARTLPGVPELLAALRARPGLTLGLLTGNYPDTGAMKLRAAGIDPDGFPVRIWGDQSPHEPPSRDHLPAVALSAYARAHGRAIDPERVTVIGDSPHDVRCALAHGCRALGVATGMHRVEDLRAAGAHLALPDLSRTDEVVAWLTGA
ncbi:MAG TPA: haloacid dehalogenase-like hydrolase [Phycisphaerales bacterium]|nr:haloacid dehalogenase-like hydrolase [Phycisphaerales bacterium]